MFAAMVTDLWPESRALSISVITDEEIRASQLREDDQQARPADLYGPDHHLVIIRLGYLGHRNAAMPGYLLSAIRGREAHRRATWLVVDPATAPWARGHLSWSPEVAEYIADTFTQVEVTP